LDNGIRTPTRTRVAQADGSHRSEGEGINSTRGNHLDGQTALEELSRFDAVLNGILEGTQFDALSILQGSYKA